MTEPMISKEELREHERLQSLAVKQQAGKGIKHDQGKPPLTMLNPEFLNMVADVHAFGAKKYGRDNYRGGMAWTRVCDALLRHVYAFAHGEDNDPESGLSHLGHAGCCLNMLSEFVTYHKNLDDRYKRPQEDCEHEKTRT